MTKKQCPLGEACDLTTAWMLGRQHAIDRYREEANPIIEAKDAEIERLRGDLAKAMEALRFYAWENEMRLPSEGPWGAGSTDFGSVARDTLAELTGAKDE